MTPAPWHISILIPARNEEVLLPRCLRSVIASLKLLPSDISTDVIVAVDRSTDRSYEIALDLLNESGTVVTSNVGSVGQARRLAATTALRRYSGDLNRCWLANTDADCSVPEDWLLKQLLHADAAYQAIAGIVDVDSFEEHLEHVASRFRETYLIHADGSHPHIHGANLGVRADTYIRANGWAGLDTAEDHDLWKRLAPYPRGQSPLAQFQFGPVAARLVEHPVVLPKHLLYTTRSTGRWWRASECSQFRVVAQARLLQRETKNETSRAVG